MNFLKDKNDNNFYFFFCPAEVPPRKCEGNQTTQASTTRGKLMGPVSSRLHQVVVSTLGFLALWKVQASRSFEVEHFLRLATAVM